MWLHTREGSLNEVDVPKKEMAVLGAEVTQTESIPWTEVYKTITNSIKLVNGDFRQDEIIPQWETINKTIERAQEFQILTITFKVSSGTYIRTLANELGKLLNTKALLFHLKRTEIGNFKLP